MLPGRLGHVPSRVSWVPLIAAYTATASNKMASLLPVLRLRPSSAFARGSYRFYAAKAAAPAPAPATASKAPAAKAKGAEPEALSSCPPQTMLVGLNYLKGQPPVLALPDEEYPPWLWQLLKPKVYEDDGPGGIAQKRKLRKENRQRIKDQNFMKTQ